MTDEFENWAMKNMPWPPAPIVPDEPVIIGDEAILSFYTHEHMIVYGKKCIDDALAKLEKNK